MSCKLPYSKFLTVGAVKPLFYSKNKNAEYTQDSLTSSAADGYSRLIAANFSTESAFDLMNYIQRVNGQYQLKPAYTSGDIILTLKNGNYVKITTLRHTSDLAIWLGLRYANDSSLLSLYAVLDDQYIYQHYVFYTVVPSDAPTELRFTYGYYRTDLTGTQHYVEYYLNINQTVNVSDFFSDTLQVPDDPYGMEENNTPSGGYGAFDYDGDDIDFPTLPTISAAACGFVGLYNPTLSELKALADYMWMGVFDISTFKKLFGDPMECILSVGIVPVIPGRSENKEALKFANVDSGVTAYKVTNQFIEVDCGSVPVNGASASAMDYAPYTKAELFLPFCGTHSLSVDEIMDSTISVKYQIDLYTGVCVAHVKISGKTNSDGSTLNSVMYQFTGNALSTIPINSANHAQFMQSALFAAAAIAATVATGGAAAAESAAAGEAFGLVSEGGAAISAGSAINTVMASKPNIIKSGNLTSNAGFLGVKYPVLTLTQPNLCRPEEEYKIAGMPLQKSGTLSSFSGFTVVSGCHLNGLLCTDAERDMIQKALFEGVIV